jgi:hypothetical protein
MKTFQVAIRYEAWVNYEVQANNKDEAIGNAWRKFEHNPPEPEYGDWTVESAQEIKE